MQVPYVHEKKLKVVDRKYLGYKNIIYKLMNEKTLQDNLGSKLPNINICMKKKTSQDASDRW